MRDGNMENVRAKAKATALLRGLDDAAAHRVAEHVVNQLVRSGSWIVALTNAVINTTKEQPK